MVTRDCRWLYQDAWNRLFSLVKLRKNLLRRLDMTAALAMAMSLAAGVIYDFDADTARELVNQIDELTPRISSDMEHVKQYADQAGLHRVRWQTSSGSWIT